VFNEPTCFHLRPEFRRPGVQDFLRRYVFRAKLILLLAEGASFNTIKRRLQTTARTIIRWKQRFLHSGLDRLDTYHPRLRRTVVMRVLRARILSATRKKPHDVHRVWKEAGLKPHRLERSWKLSHTLVLRPTVLFQVRGKISVDSALYRLIMNII
jgi:transposase